MNGAQALIRTLVDAGVDTCFTNPGTSEMHFVSALDAVPEMRAVLALFEGVASQKTVVLVVVRHQNGERLGFLRQTDPSPARLPR